MSSWASTKTYGHAEGLSVCFRQHRAESHCSFLHGYALSFTVVFEAFDLDHRGWVMDFGGLRPLKDWLKSTFDHKTVVAADDPEISTFRALSEAGVLELVILEDGVGCERFAEHVGKWVTAWLDKTYPRIRCSSVECREHGANSAIWRNV